MSPTPGDALRRPLFVAALVVAAVVVLVEVGMAGLVGGGSAGAVPAEVAAGLGVDPAATSAGGEAPPGSALRHLALVDGLLLFTLALLGSSLVVPHRAYGRAQGAVTLVVSLLWLVLGVLAAVLAFAQLLLMIGLFTAAPFGTLAYLAIWGFFPVGEAALVLGLLLALKIALAVLLVVAHPRFATVKGLVALLAVSVLLQVVLGVVHGFLPRPVVAIGDQLWAVVTSVVAAVWALVMLVLAIPAVVNAVRVGVAAD